MKKIQFLILVICLIDQPYVEAIGSKNALKQFSIDLNHDKHEAPKYNVDLSHPSKYFIQSVTNQSGYIQAHSIYSLVPK